MSDSNSSEIVIHGTTSKGKVFRPSDWAERLCGILSSFDKGNRLAYHQWVRPILLDKVRSVAVDKQLEEINPAMFRFLMDFAADNDLRVLDDTADAAAPETANPPVEMPAAVQPAAEEEADTSVLREIEAHETTVAFAALSILRPALADVGRFIEQINDIQRPAGYRLIGIFEEGKTNAVAVCGFRFATNLSCGRHTVIEDIITVPQGRERGYAARLLGKVAELSAAEGISLIHADSAVGSHRADSHRMYFQYGFEISAHHFTCRTDQFGS